MDAPSTLFERARDALRRYDSAAADELELAWKRTPWCVAIVEDAAMGEVLTAVCGEWIAGGPALRVRERNEWIGTAFQQACRRDLLRL